MPSRKSSLANSGRSWRNTWWTFASNDSARPSRIIRLVACTASGAFAAISRAHAPSPVRCVAWYDPCSPDRARGLRARSRSGRETRSSAAVPPRAWSSQLPPLRQGPQFGEDRASWHPPRRCARRIPERGRGRSPGGAVHGGETACRDCAGPAGACRDRIESARAESLPAASSRRSRRRRITSGAVRTTTRTSGSSGRRAGRERLSSMAA